MKVPKMLFFSSVIIGIAFSSPNELLPKIANTLSKQLSKEVTLSYCSLVGMSIYAQDQKQQYLGLITDNEFSSESIINEFGNYGSQFSSTSILNQFSNYGSEFNSYSAYNQFSSTPPIIYSYSASTGKYTPEAYLTKNTFKSPAVDPDLLIAALKNGCSTPTYITDLYVDSLMCSVVGDSIRVHFIVSNEGNTNISTAFKIGLYNNSSLINTWTSPSTLQPGYYYWYTVSLKPTVQSNIITASADYTGLVTEVSESNNSLSKTVNVSLSGVFENGYSNGGRHPKHISITGQSIFIAPPDQQSVLSIVNLSGKTMASFKIGQHSSFNIPISSLRLSAGTYICNLFGQDKIIERSNLVINK